MKDDNVTFTITCTMKSRWVPHFVGFLKHMQRLGGMGSSRWIHFFADGDGDFRPKFTGASFDAEPGAPAMKTTGQNECWWDAG